MFGLGNKKFNEMAEGLQKLWLQHWAKRPGRQRVVGGGRRGKLSSGQHKATFILFYLKVYPTFGVLSVVRGINRGQCNRWVQALLPLLEKLLGQKCLLPARKIDSLQAFCKPFPKPWSCVSTVLNAPLSGLKKNE